MSCRLKMVHLSEKDHIEILTMICYSNPIRKILKIVKYHQSMQKMSDDNLNKHFLAKALFSHETTFCLNGKIKLDNSRY